MFAVLGILSWIHCRILSPNQFCHACGQVVKTASLPALMIAGSSHKVGVRAWLGGHMEQAKFCLLFCPHPMIIPPAFMPRGGYIVFVFPFVRSLVCRFGRTSVTFVEFASKVLRQSFSSAVYLSNYLPESIHIWTIVTLKGWH